jgi:hypothetical protein
MQQLSVSASDAVTNSRRRELVLVSLNVCALALDVSSTVLQVIQRHAVSCCTSRACVYTSNSSSSSSSCRCQQCANLSTCTAAHTTASLQILLLLVAATLSALACKCETYGTLCLLF